MKRVDFLPAARRDLAAIFLYTEAKFGRAQADRYTTEIAASCERVLSGSVPVRSVRKLGDGLQFHRYKSHLIFHRLGPGGDLEIVRILHGRMRISDHL